MVTLKNDFLTIPDAPNYEINSELIVRNKKTGRILTPQKKGQYVSVKLCSSGKFLAGRSTKTLRAQALAALENGNKWLPVPSLGGKYELNSRGILRNASSKRTLKIFNRHHFISFRIPVNGKTNYFSLNSLLWEVFGVTPPLPVQPAVKCSAFKDGLYRNFDSLNACARFLAPLCFLSSGAVLYHLWKRKSDVYGWKISYTPPDEWSPEKESISRKLLRGVGK